MMIDKTTRDAYMAREHALHDWMRANKTNSYRPEDLPENLRPTLTNDQRADVEEFDWINDPSMRYFAYTKSTARDGITSDVVTSWTGRTLAAIVWTGAVFRSSFGDHRANFRAKGTNGQMYAGTAYIDAGDYVRMRAIKGSN